MSQQPPSNRKLLIKRNIPMLLFAVVLFALGVWAMLNDQLFVAPTQKIERRNMALYLVAIALPIPLSQLRLQVGKWGNILFRILYMLVGMFLAMVMFNVVTWGPAFSTKSWSMLINMSIVSVFFMVVWVFAWNVKATVPISCALVSVLAYLYRVVYEFRGTPVTPGDLFTLDTAANVAGQYTYTFKGVDVLALVVVGALIILGCVMPSPKPRALWLKISKPVLVALSIGWVFMLCTTPYLQKHGYYIPAWLNTYHIVAEAQGPMATFIRDAAGIRGIKPDGYGDQAVLDAEQTLQAYNAQAGVDTGFRPNVIAIMNESFADYESLLALETNQEVLPFWHSLGENTVKGKLFVSVLGGGTCNTEHHFLTSTQYAAGQKTPLYSTVLLNTPTLAWQMKSLGYQTVAIHPNLGRNYNRSRVYPLLGFDTFLDQEAFTGMEKYRPFYSDRACYQKIIELYEQKQEGTPLFVFNVTMQNHGGYDYEMEPDVITLMNEDERNAEKTEYLNCLHMADTAFSELVAYFEKQQEPTIILMFGDHQVSLPFSSPMREGATEVETALSNYITTFAIWANYPIESKELSMMSDHYLAPLLLKTAGLPLTQYDAYLLDLANDYPVLTTFGFANSRGEYTPYQGSEQPEASLQQLDIMRYNRLYDNAARLQELSAGM